MPIAGRGFGDVYQGTLHCGIKVAIKCPRLYFNTSEGGVLKVAAREIYAWSKCKHAHVLELSGLALFRGYIAMVSPWMAHGTLPQYLVQYPDSDRCEFCRQIASGLAYLHMIDVVHGDVKGANVLVSEDGVAKLTDFGNTILKTHTLRFTGTNSAPNLSLRWTAPEVLNGITGHTRQADVYALGMTILEVVSGDVPFQGRTDIAVYGDIMKKSYPVRPEATIPTASRNGDFLWRLLTLCWAHDQTTRPKALHVLDQLRNVTKEGLIEVRPRGRGPGSQGYLEAALEYYRRRFVNPRRPQLPVAPVKPKLPRLPVELHERISDFLFDLQPPKLDAVVDEELLSTKPLWKDVYGFMTASVDLHKMGYIRWIQVITVKSPADWEYLVPDAHLIRYLCVLPQLKLRILDQALASIHKRVLSHFPYLTAVTIDSHSDISHNAGNQFAYRNLVTAFPPSLRRLEILHAHRPDIEVVATVKEHCPRLEHLRLGRCTMFNRADPCAFWSSHPFHHEFYFLTEGTEEELHFFAEKLVHLKELKSLRMGLYFVSSDIVLAHRLYHRRGLPAPEPMLWLEATPLAETEMPGSPEQATTSRRISLLHQPDPETEFGPGHNCALCTELTSQITEDSERSANAILSKLVPSLSQVQRMRWLSPKHLGVGTYTLKRG